MTKLSSIADYVTDKISSNDIALREYVTTDCILQNKKGREIATNLPPQSCCLTRYQHGDVLIANIRPYLKKVWFADIDGGASSDVLVFRAKEGHSPSFLYAVLLQDSFFDYVMQGAKGSKMPRGDKEQILRYEMPTLSCSEESIGTFFLNLDQKIRLNEQINQNLEAMAKQIYDYWFVQFDFPNEEGKPYKSSGGAMVWNEKLHREIPRNWDVVTLSEYLNVYSEKISAINLDVNCKYTPIEVLPRRRMSFNECAPIENAVSGLCRFGKKQILLSNRRVYFHKVCIAAFDGVTRDTVIILSPVNKALLGYAYQIINDDVFIEYATRHSYGSEEPVLSWESAKIYKTLKPSNQLDIIYSKRISPIIDSVIRNELEIAELTKQRDELLPLLMNGQVSVNSDLAVSYITILR